MDISKYGKHGSSILIYLLKNGEVPITDFSKINIGPTSYYRSLSNLEGDGLVKRRETINRRKIVLVSLTEKGKEFAEKLVELEEVAETPADQEAEAIIHFDGEDINVKLTPEQEKNTKYLKFLFHSNVLDNHISVEEAIPGKPTRNFNIYVKQNGHGIFRLWCEQDDSYECWHVREAWGYPQVQKMMTQYKGRVKICSVCGYENPENAKYCMECGAKLE